MTSTPITTARWWLPRDRYRCAMSRAAMAPAHPDRSSIVAQRGIPRCSCTNVTAAGNGYSGLLVERTSRSTSAGSSWAASSARRAAVAAIAEVPERCAPVTGSATQCRRSTWIVARTSSGMGPANRSSSAFVMGSPGRHAPVARIRVMEAAGLAGRSTRGRRPSRSCSPGRRRRRQRLDGGTRGAPGRR